MRPDSVPNPASIIFSALRVLSVALLAASLSIGPISSASAASPEDVGMAGTGTMCEHEMAGPDMPQSMAMEDCEGAAECCDACQMADCPLVSGSPPYPLPHNAAIGRITLPDVSRHAVSDDRFDSIAFLTPKRPPRI